MNGDQWARARTVECPTCGAEAGAFCLTSSGRFAEQPHVARIAAARPVPTEEEIAARQRADAIHNAEWASAVRTTFILSCGCTEPPSEPIPMREWPITSPGAVTACEVHDEYAIVVEVRTRLVADVATLRRLYEASGLDEDAAEELARDQADDPG